MRRTLAIVALWTLAACDRGPGRITGPEPATPPAGFRVFGYFGGWDVASGVRIADLPVGGLTHLAYAFANVSPDGRVVVGDDCLDAGRCGAGSGGGGNLAALAALKARYPQLRVLISVGGWTWSGNFSTAAATADGRSAFAASAIETFLRGWPAVFDGIDIDWEYPVGGGLPGNGARPEDRQNFTLLLTELRRQLDAEGLRTGRSYLLTAATPAGPQRANLELSRVAAIVDWLNVMTYDYHSGDGSANFNSPLLAAGGDPTPQLNIDATVGAYLAAGVPGARINVGIPFYGRGLGGVEATNGGLFQPGSSALALEWAEVAYRDIAARRPEQNGFRRYWQNDARVPWLYHAGRKIWVSYDDSTSVAAKAAYVRDHALGGVMFWELGGDDGSLLRAIGTGLAPRTVVAR